MSQQGKVLCFTIFIAIISNIRCNETDLDLPVVTCYIRPTGISSSDPVYLRICGSKVELNETHPYFRFYEHDSLNVATSKIHFGYMKMHTFTNDTCDTFPNTTDLRLYDINLQKIMTTAFNNCKDLESLDLWNNSLTDISAETFSSLSKLTYLGLALNKVTTFEPNLFSNLINLESLIINNNMLKQFSVDNLQNSKKILDIDVCNNEIQNINTDEILNTFSLLREFRINKSELMDKDEYQEIIKKFEEKHIITRCLIM